MKRIIALAMVVLMALALLAGCTTSNQTAAQPEETAAQQEAAVTDEATATDEAAAPTDAATTATDTYDMQPRTVTDHTLKVALIPVTINTSYTMTINGAKEHIKTMGYNMDLTVEAPSRSIGYAPPQNPTPLIWIYLLSCREFI